jgi:cellobiose-specific phosphotransferase system component IIB
MRHDKIYERGAMKTHTISGMLLTKYEQTAQAQRLAKAIWHNRAQNLLKKPKVDALLLSPQILQ